MIYYIYVDEEIIGFKFNNNVYFYDKNIQGDVIGIFDSNHNKIVTYEYDSLGKITNIYDDSLIDLGNVNPIRYRSYYYDSESSLYYIKSRYYYPTIGRFINLDDTEILNKIQDEEKNKLQSILLLC